MTRPRFDEPTYCPRCRDGLAHRTHSAVRFSVVERFRAMLPNIEHEAVCFSPPGQPVRTRLGRWCEARIACR